MNWGVLGCASIAQRSVIPSILSIPENKLVAVASRTKSLAEKVAGDFNTEGIEGYQQLLHRSDIEAVYIPLPTGLHYEWVMNALTAGKHVLVEKSSFSSAAEAMEAVELARKNNLAIVENFQFQHHSQHAFVKKLLSGDEIGEIRCFRSSFGFPPFDAESNIRYKPELGGGSLLDSGAYTVKATSFILGEGFEVKAAHLHEHKKFGVDWFGGAFLVNKERGVFSEVAFGFDNYYQCNYEIWGSRGRIVSTRAFTARADFRPTIILEKEGKTQELVLDTDDHFRNMLIHFNKAVSEKNFEQEWNSVLEQARLVQQVRDLSSQPV